MKQQSEHHHTEHNEPAITVRGVVEDFLKLDEWSPSPYSAKS